MFPHHLSDVPSTNGNTTGRGLFCSLFCFRSVLFTLIWSFTFLNVQFHFYSDEGLRWRPKRQGIVIGCVDLIFVTGYYILPRTYKATCWLASKKVYAANRKHKLDIAYWNYIVPGSHITKKSKNKQMNLYSALYISPLSLALIYGPCVTRRSPSFTCHPHTNRIPAFTPQPQGVTHRPLTGTHCTFPRKDS